MECIREPAGRLKQLEEILGKKAKKVWRDCDQIVASKGVDLPDWPDWCVLPITSVVSQKANGVSGDILHGAEVAHFIAGLYTWRLQKIILDFDVDLAKTVFDSGLSDELPCQALLSLPFYCPYISISEDVRSELLKRISSSSAQGIVSGIQGVFVFLGLDAKQQYPELRFLLDIEGGGLNPLKLHLNRSSFTGALASTIEDSLAQFVQGMDSADKKGIVDKVLSDLGEVLLPLLKLTLYLCSSDKDMHSKSPLDSTRGKRLVVKRTRKRAIVEVARNPSHIQVGYRIGAKLRQQGVIGSDGQSSGQNMADDIRKSPKGHWRRGHFHSYRIGKIKSADGVLIDKEERGLVTRWLPPVPVNVANVEDLNITMRSVE